MDYTIYQEVPEQEIINTSEIVNITINDMLNSQMQQEKINCYIYLNFAAICNFKGLLGAFKFFKEQANEELEHSNWIFDYICDRVGFSPMLLEIPAQEFNENKFLYDMITESLELEIHTTELLCDIKKVAIEQSDFITSTFLDKLITEQREEERLFNDILNRIKMFGDTHGGIQKLDNELASMKIFKG